MLLYYVQKPRARNAFRRFIGKEYFIFKQKISWLKDRSKFAGVDKDSAYPHSLIAHRSLLLRPLKDVEMYLQENKIVNLRLAINAIDKTVIRPGEVFSFWKLVGRPSKRKGYIEGLVLNNGAISKGIGGGLCQLGNLLYWLALHTPLAIKQRHRHGYDVFPDVNRNVPFACGATLAYNYIDLQLQNNTADSYQLHLWLEDGYLYGKITSNVNTAVRYDVFETDHCFKQQWWGGYTRHNKIWKRITTGDRVEEELIAVNNAIMMYDPLVK